MLREGAELPNYAVSTDSTMSESKYLICASNGRKVGKYCSIYSWSMYYRVVVQRDANDMVHENKAR